MKSVLRFATLHSYFFLQYSSVEECWRLSNRCVSGSRNGRGGEWPTTGATSARCRQWKLFVLVDFCICICRLFGLKSQGRSKSYWFVFFSQNSFVKVLIFEENWGLNLCKRWTSSGYFKIIIKEMKKLFPCFSWHFLFFSENYFEKALCRIFIY